ncbi:MAG: hypothetical protein HY078_05385 [Elusimicrobia bacterium]|nr:hypothetical protein [Elusimicrobiota bacterium]
MRAGAPSRIFLVLASILSLLVSTADARSGARRAKPSPASMRRIRVDTPAQLAFRARELEKLRDAARSSKKTGWKRKVELALKTVNARLNRRMDDICGGSCALVAAWHQPKWRSGWPETYAQVLSRTGDNVYHAIAEDGSVLVWQRADAKGYELVSYPWNENVAEFMRAVMTERGARPRGSPVSLACLSAGPDCAAVAQREMERRRIAIFPSGSRDCASPCYRVGERRYPIGLELTVVPYSETSPLNPSMPIAESQRSGVSVYLPLSRS